MEVNFRKGGHSPGDVVGSATHVFQMKSVSFIGADCLFLFMKAANRVSQLHNRFVLCYSNRLKGR